MPTQKIDPKVIFASNAPAIDNPPIFSDKTKGWDVARANDGRPEIPQMNKMQQDTDLKILWLNENSVAPYDASIDYPDSAVAIKDGSFKQLVSGAWVEFLDDFADKAEVSAALLAKTDKTYVDGQLSLKADKAEVNSGINKFYPTLAQANADIANIAVNQPVNISESQNFGLWYKVTVGATILTKSPYDSLIQSKNYTDQSNNTLKNSMLQSSKNLFNPAKIVIGSYIMNTGVIAAQANWSVSDYIPVTAGLSYAVSAVSRRAGLAFYDASRVLVAGSYNASNPAIVTAPAGAAYLVINVDSNVIVSSNVQVEQSLSVTSYVPYVELIKEEKIPENIVRNTELEALVAKTELAELVNPLTIKDYDVLIPSKNLFNSAAIITGKYLNTSGVIMSQAGWSISDYIPVTAGLSYVVSAEARRTGMAFYDASKNLIAGSYTAGIVAVAPAGAAYLVINVDSNVIVSSNVQVEQSLSVTSYVPFGDTVKIDPSFINFSETANHKHALKITGFRAVLSGMLDESTPIEVKLVVDQPLSHSKSSVFNFEGDTINGVLQRALSDEPAPMRLDGYAIGANHGYQRSCLTLAAHGKTAADIGSVWLSGGKEYVIVDIVSTSVLSITARADNTAFTLAELTHVSGATNTASFIPTATAANQWYPAIRDRKITCFIDNKLIDLSIDATHEFTETVKFLESYSIMRKTDMVEWLIANKGQNYLNYAGAPCYTVNFGYTFDRELGCTIYFGGVGRKAVALQDQMITQSTQLAQGNGTVYNYIPKAVEFTNGGFTYNFSQLENLFSKNPSSAIFMTAARQEAGTNPIDRVIMLNDQVGYATGYLPILDAAPNVRVTNASNKYLEIRNGSLKLYPRLIDSASITQINDGDAFAAIAYRKYFKRSTDQTCKYVVRSEMGDYLYLDWHAAKTDEIEIPADLIGREFEIFEKSSNVTLLSKFASNSILVKVDPSKNYGYLVLKFL